MTIGEFLKQTDLEHSLLMGYYGGGNYGDELLLEVIQNIVARKGTKHVDIAYMPYAPYQTFHHDFGYKPFQANSVPQLLKAIWRNKRIIVGGGGIWGLDAVPQVFLMSAALFMSRWLSGKKVYLIGVGYYNSTNRLGHISAWLAGKASNLIIGRDPETVQNFGRYNNNVHQDTDIAWYLRDIDPAPYEQEVAELESRLPVTQNTLLVTLRRFNPRHKNEYTNIVGQALAKYPTRNILVMLLEPKSVDPEAYDLLQQWQKKYPNITIADSSFNPVAFYLFMKKHKQNLSVLSPQFHALLTAHLAGVPFLPLIYDNKSQALLQSIKAPVTYSIYDLQPSVVEQFIEGTV